VIGVPFNDQGCLAGITEIVAELVEHHDQAIVDIAAEHSTTESLATWIRSLPQRDDDGAKYDGPKVETCKPPQRLRIPAPDPNCVERAALYLAVAELIEPKPFRQLATLDTPVGLHTFPIENGVPMILDPTLPRNAIDGGLFVMSRRQAIPVEARDAIDWTGELAESVAVQTRNGLSRVRRARNAVDQLVTRGTPLPDAATLDAVGYFFAVAERAARDYGPRAIEVVRTTALAIADLAERALARLPRNLAFEIGGSRFEVPSWLSGLAEVAGRVGLDAGAMALRSQLGGGDVPRAVESW
jgi:hypothetical protein